MEPLDDEYLPIEALRERTVAEKGARRQRVATLPILDKFRLMERMREEGKLLRTWRETQP